MRRPRRSSAEASAHRLLDELGITEVPVPLDEVADRLGYRVVREPMGADVSGMSYREGATAIIGLNSSHSSKRRRFTQAHEIGHLRLHEGRPLTVDSSIRVNFRDNVSSQATDAEEIEANAFAAALLMPSDRVIAAARTLSEDGIRSREKLTARLAAVFDVSPEAMGYRLINLGVASAP